MMGRVHSVAVGHYQTCVDKADKNGGIRVFGLARCRRKMHGECSWKAKSLAILQGFFYLAPQPGLEPGTYGLTVRRSTD